MTKQNNKLKEALASALNQLSDKAVSEAIQNINAGRNIQGERLNKNSFRLDSEATAKCNVKDSDCDFEIEIRITWDW